MNADRSLRGEVNYEPATGDIRSGRFKNRQRFQHDEREKKEIGRM